MKIIPGLRTLRSDFIRTAAWILCAVAIFVFLVASAEVLRTNAIFDYGEGVVLNLAKNLMDKGTYFFDINHPPFIHGVYPPIFPLLISLAWHSAPPLLFGRLLSFVAALASAFVLYKLLRGKIAAEPSAQLAIIFLTSWFMISFAPILRIDTLAVFLSLVGIYCFLNLGSRFWISGPIFILAFYTKQTAIIAPIAVLLCLAAGQNWKKLGVFSASYLLPLAVSFFTINAATAGQFALHLFTYNNIALNWTHIWGGYAAFSLSCLPLFALLVLNSGKKELSFFHIYFFLSFLSLFSFAKPGASSNYFIEPLAALILLIGYLLSADQRSSVLGKSYLRTEIFFSAQLILSMLVFFNFLASPLSPPKPTQEMVIREINNAPPGEILSEEIGYLVLAGKDVHLEPFQFSRLAKEGRWDDSPLIKDCEASKFSLVWAGPRILSLPNLAGCLNRFYARQTLPGGYFLYTKKSAPPSASL
ncbi:MAG: hypothetical protein LiPW15_740 [Parcubacteria group bacterium LiPW_15]|nr:MAG: hypothetical protein LiPW15_740 [Parcubacteria group bacterium LiPW_15]